ncbi:MAG TPA: NAD-dependent epimerase/dehydratase family protein [Friedmanniella sp.]
MPDQTSTPLHRRVVLTRAAGRIGRAVCGRLAERWDLLPTDRRAGPDGVRALDVTDLEACRATFAGADAVVHLAANPSPDATFDALLAPNLVGPYAVARAAADAGVALRIGYSSVEQPAADAALADRLAWLSAIDAAALVHAAVEADLPTGVDGFVVAHGVSANRHNVVELEQTRRAIGYAPVDDAWAGR